MVINNLQKHLHNPAFVEIQFSSRILNLETVLENEQIQKAFERKNTTKKNWRLKYPNGSVIGWFMIRSKS